MGLDDALEALPLDIARKRAPPCWADSGRVIILELGISVA